MSRRSILNPHGTLGAFAAVLLLLLSCGGGDDASAALGEIPDTVSTQFRQVSVSPEGRLEIESERVETYNKADKTIFYEAGMRELDDQGMLTLEGGAERIEIGGNRDGSAEGRIHIHDVEEDSRLEAESLSWDNGARQLTGDGEVSISTGDGLQITGEGFVADMARERYTFSQGVEGTLELDDDN